MRQKRIIGIAHIEHLAHVLRDDARKSAGQRGRQASTVRDAVADAWWLGEVAHAHIGGHLFTLFC